MPQQPDALQPRAGAMLAEPVEMPAKPAEPVEPVEDKNEDESEDRSEDESEDESESESKAQDESEDFAVFCFETQSNGVRLTLALGLGHVWRSPKLRRAFQGTRDFFGSYKGSMCRPHCLKLLCAQYKWIQVEEAKDFLGFGSEASVSDAEVLRAADMFNGELKSIFGDLEEAWRRLFRVLKPCKCCGGGYGNGRCTGCEWIANRWEPFLVGKAILMAFGVDTAISPSNMVLAAFDLVSQYAHTARTRHLTLVFRICTALLHHP